MNGPSRLIVLLAVAAWPIALVPARRWRRSIRPALRQLRKVVVLIVGSAVLLAGLVMIVAPGPAIAVIPLGLAILATEFSWARQLLRRIRQRAADTAGQIRGRRQRTATGKEPPAS